MKAEHLIEALNDHIAGKRKNKGIKCRDFLVLQKYAKQHKTIKAYSEYTYIVWLVHNKKKYEVLKVSDVFNTTEVQTDLGPEEVLWEKMDFLLGKTLFDFIWSKEYYAVLEGSYGNTSK